MTKYLDDTGCPITIDSLVAITLTGPYAARRGTVVGLGKLNPFFNTILAPMVFVRMTGGDAIMEFYPRNIRILKKGATDEV
jgi:hypothetical protein